MYVCIYVLRMNAYMHARVCMYVRVHYVCMCVYVCMYVLLCMYVVRGDARWRCSCFQCLADGDRFLPAISMKIRIFPAYTSTACNTGVPALYPTSHNQESQCRLMQERWCEPAVSPLLQLNPHVACGSAPWQIIRKTIISFTIMLPGCNAKMKPPIFTQCFPHASFTYLCGYVVYSLQTLIYVLPYSYIQCICLQHLIRPYPYTNKLQIHTYI
jgi:hypothetical protein